MGNGNVGYTEVTITPATGYVQPTTWDYQMINGRMTRVDNAILATVKMDMPETISAETGQGPYKVCDICLMAYRKVNMVVTKQGRYRCQRCNR